MDWAPLLLSFKVATIATGIAAALGIALAALLASKQFPGRNLLDVITTIPMVLPPTVMGYYVLVTVGRDTLIGQVHEQIFGSPIVFTQTGVVMAGTIGCLPLVVKSARAALEGVDHGYVNAARTLGAGPMRRFFIIRLPLAAGGILAGVMLGFARALGDFGLTIMVAGNIPGQTQTAPLAIYDAIQSNREDDATGMALVLTAFALLTLYIVGNITRKSYL